MAQLLKYYIYITADTAFFGYWLNLPSLITAVYKDTPVAFHYNLVLDVE